MAPAAHKLSAYEPSTGKPPQPAKPATAARPAGTAKPLGATKPPGPAKPAGGAKPPGARKPARAVKPAGTPKPPGVAKPPGAAKPAAAKPPGVAKPAVPTKPYGAPKPAGVSKPAAAVKRPEPARSAKPIHPTPRKRGLQRRAHSPDRSLGPRTEPRPFTEQSQSVARQAPVARKLTCSIFAWRDGQIADFYAVASGLQGHTWVIERSPRFAWVVGDFPAEAYTAHASLVSTLLRAGWRSVGFEGAWYRQCFELPIESPSLDR
jgi:hypothetical protein